jgi:FkbM family methyltransferase
MKVKNWKFRGQLFQFVHSDVHASWWSFEDEQSVREALWDIKPGDLVLDIGCAYGSYTLPALAAGAAKVICWTPDENELALLRQSLKLNGWEDKCIIKAAGVFGKDGWLEAYTQAFSEGPFTQAFTGPQQVFEVHPLEFWKDEIPTDYERVWMKLDVEGAEFDILQGAEQLLQTLNPHVFVENHEFKAPGIGNRIKEFLEGLGWTHIETRPYHSITHSSYAPKA